jgi:hypothetical protein
LSDEDRANCEVVLDAMGIAADFVYEAGRNAEFHQFLEFTGFIREYIKICRWQLNAGKDFRTETPILESFQVKYIGEKFECIFRSMFWKSGIIPTVKAFCGSAFDVDVEVKPRGIWESSRSLEEDVRIGVVPGEEVSPRSLRAEDYMGRPAEPDTQTEEFFQKLDLLVDDALTEELERYEWDVSDVTACCGSNVFVPDDPTEGPAPQCAKCGEQLPRLVNREPPDPELPPESCGKPARW